MRYLSSVLPCLLLCAFGCGGAAQTGSSYGVAEAPMFGTKDDGKPEQAKNADGDKVKGGGEVKEETPRKIIYTAQRYSTSTQLPLPVNTTLLHNEFTNPMPRPRYKVV